MTDFSESFIYNEDSESKLSWLSGESAGFIDSSSDLPYWRVRLNGSTFRVHRIIWELLNGPIPEGLVIDHRNRDSLDNTSSNLRCITQAENAKNKGIYKNNNTGHQGVQYTECRSKSGTLVRKYVASIRDANSNKKQRSFSCRKYGDDLALRLAVIWRDENNPTMEG